MAAPTEFNLVSVLLRAAFSLALVFLTFNPSGHSYYHWLTGTLPHIQPVVVIARHRVARHRHVVGPHPRAHLGPGLGGPCRFLNGRLRHPGRINATRKLAAYFNMTIRMATAVDMMTHEEHHSAHR